MTNTDNIFDWYWQPSQQLDTAQILKSTQDSIALDKLKQTTQNQCDKIKNQHHIHAMEMQQILDKMMK
ncbi:hypothetical protein [uncultured Shewanella sp.]|uniref:hypothetical protein n=1 Tax=uncultured Shewanella sp. TaxID=173975 RepID=UPI002606275C|nr:hypothetical protein [uncultured Shewanella sp.]